MIITTTIIAVVLATSTPNQDNQADLDDNVIYEASDKAKEIKAANESLKRIKG